jgi:hypothetical protein
VKIFVGAPVIDFTEFDSRPSSTEALAIAHAKIKTDKIDKAARRGGERAMSLRPSSADDEGEIQ